MEIKKIVNFIFELNQLTRQRNSGWTLAGVASPNSIAEHQLRTAQIGYLLATMENYENPEKVAAMLLIHDNGETRIGDQNKVSARYIDKKKPEADAFNEQLAGLGEIVEKRWTQYFQEFENRSTPAGVIAKDADWLETAFQAKEYLDLGHASAQNWIDNVEKALETTLKKNFHPN